MTFCRPSCQIGPSGSGQPTYLDLYHHMDIDGSGTVDFDE